MVFSLLVFSSCLLLVGSARAQVAAGSCTNSALDWVSQLIYASLIMTS